MNMEELQGEKMIIREVETGISSQAVGGRDMLQGVRKNQFDTGHW